MDWDYKVSLLSVAGRVFRGKKIFIDDGADNGGS